MKPRVFCNHPLLDKLRRLDREARRRFPAPFPLDAGLGALGMIRYRGLRHRNYPCTPLNCWTFAPTGGDGVHFSLLALDRSVNERSPVVMTSPTVFHAPNLIVGESLFDFLCLGTHRGYFSLMGLAYGGEREQTLRACTDPSSQLSDEPEWDAHKQRLLALLVKRFGLRPWTDLERFEQVQEQYSGMLELPAAPDYRLSGER